MNLFYRQTGNGAPLFILHGLFGSGDNWNSMAKELSACFSVFVVDLRNHGQSLHSNEWDYTIMASDIARLASTLHLNKIYIAGHSMGGKVCMQLACQSPEIIEKMMVIDIAPRYYKPHHQQILAGLNSLDFNKIKSRKEAEEGLSMYIKETGTLQFLLKNLYWVGPEKLGWRFNLDVITQKIECVGQDFQGNCKNTFLSPVSFIKGDKSDYINDNDFLIINKLYPNSELITIKDAGHWVHAEKPRELLAEMLRFFDK